MIHDLINFAMFVCTKKFNFLICYLKAQSSELKTLKSLSYQMKSTHYASCFRYETFMQEVIFAFHLLQTLLLQAFECSFYHYVVEKSF